MLRAHCVATCLAAAVSGAVGAPPALGPLRKRPTATRPAKNVNRDAEKRLVPARCRKGPLGSAIQPRPHCFTSPAHTFYIAEDYWRGLSADARERLAMIHSADAWNMIRAEKLGLKPENQLRDDGTLNFGHGWHSDAFNAMASFAAIDAPRLQDIATCTSYRGRTVFWTAEARRHVQERCKFYEGTVVPVSDVWISCRGVHNVAVLQGASGSGKTITLLHQREFTATFYMRATELLLQLGTDGRPLSTRFKGPAALSFHEQCDLATSIVEWGVLALLGGTPRSLARNGYARILVAIDDADEYPAFVRAVHAQEASCFPIRHEISSMCGASETVIAVALSQVNPKLHRPIRFTFDCYTLVEPCPKVWQKCCRKNPRFAAVFPAQPSDRDTELQRRARAFVGNARGAWAFAEVLHRHTELQRVVNDATLAELLAEAVNFVRDAGFSGPC